MKSQTEQTHHLTVSDTITIEDWKSLDPYCATRPMLARDHHSQKSGYLMYNHEYFQELSALAVIGQLSVDEDRELNSHLLECARCREAYGDYARVIQHQ